MARRLQAAGRRAAHADGAAVHPAGGRRGHGAHLGIFALAWAWLRGLLSLGWLFRDGMGLLVSAATGLVGVSCAVSMGHLNFAAWQHADPRIGH